MGCCTCAVALVLAGVAVLYWLTKKRGTKPVSKPVTKNWKEGVFVSVWNKEKGNIAGLVYLYQFPRTKYVPSLSPFSFKLETWLRMANIEYEVLFALISRQRKRKICAECGNSGYVLGTLR